ncbi:hypothetical protein DAPPUDRAFT_320217 [Daphnia pulex]|uniref:Uncharacterized protein n=1 Tax=Daphnia pulex TaxID=6669 RepID=E9GP72_DAPPU|nr:hypothetical protein DAPPUDRAFT_320217 [Daphnia pulex]|eukprot:EFX78727.1 hypothetical protein DAPPUDRAFT_320217 [Daphnia pulex]
MEEKVKELRVIAANELLQSNCDALASPPTHLLASSSVIRSPQPSTSSNSESAKNLFYQNRDGNPASQVVQLNHGEVFSEDTSEIENFYSAVNASNIEHQQHGILQDQHDSNSDDSAISDTGYDEVFTCKSLTHHQSVWNSTSKTEWNLFSYSKDFTDGDGQHIFKSGVVNCFSESSKEISAERNKLLLELHGKELLKTTVGKRAYHPSNIKVSHTRNKEKSKKKTVPVKSKSTSLTKPKAAVPSAVPFQQKAIESLVPEKQGVKRKLEYPESSDSNFEEEKEKDDDFFGSIHSTSSQSREIADVGRP